MIGIQKHSKRDLKNNKIIQKELEDLQREASQMNRKYQAQQHPDSDSENQYMDRKAKKWWSRFDQRHFRVPYQRQYQRLRDITTSERILQQSPPDPLPYQIFSQYKITNEYDLFSESDLIHVLFKSKDPKFRFLASYYLTNDLEIPTDLPLQEEVSKFKVTSSGKQVKEMEGEGDNSYKLGLAGYSEDEQLCRSVSQYNRSLEKHSSKNQLEFELYMWQKQLASVDKENQHTWDKLIKSIRKETQKDGQSQQQITQIRDYLMSMTILKCFEHGFDDKTTTQLNQLLQSQRQLKPAKNKDANNKKFFQTDCKICFCSFNNDSNQVLYCDKCNTSFHLACYGLQQVPKQQTYFCDYCKAMKKENIKKIVCQLCNKTKFPIKEVHGHYYHVTCLVIFNLVQIQNGELVFRKSIDHSKILQMVVDSELNQQDCQFCSHMSGGDLGIRMKCSFAGCQQSAHPICAYINGCKFWVRKDQQKRKIDISYHCNKHNSSRDWIQQTYLRRYMCNFRKTSQLKEPVFKQNYKIELQQIINGYKQSRTWSSSKIIEKTKFLKRKKNQQEQKTNNGSQVQTQTMKILEKYKKKK